MPLAEDVTCHYCNRVLHGGRTDRKFCNDTCRNAFNRERRKADERLFGDDIQERIFKIIRKNHALLVKFNPLQENDHVANREALYQAGFNFEYFTSADTGSDGKLRRYCFEQNWVELDYGLLLLGVNEKKIALVGY